ncbi:alpha/beta hydrolase [Clostridium cibarium]|uniref:Alpha/beta hydrolase n=1 Tax=Clostridium cibarium TaxID=2762247 RepID=A0ABR8PTI2_9CLOT|nr:alpha/beta hydrolase [Clostridium cibarium]MBD7911476.1 alpha/beta hydrolase [Clostridium cibarium]
MILSILIAILIVFTIVFSIFLHFASEYAFKEAFYARRKTKEDSIKRLNNWGLWNEEYFENLQMEDVFITSKDGLNLCGHLIERFEDSNRYIILVHGYSANHYLHMPFIPMFLKERFNILLVEERSHGESEGKYATYGYKEKEDLNLWINFLEERKGEELFLGLHGQSMGAATVLLCGARNRKVKFVIEDCGYSSGKELMRYQFSKVDYVPFGLVYWLLNLKVKRRCGFKFEDVCPINAIAKSEVPIFFIHGDADKKVPVNMAIDMYKRRNREGDMILIVPNAVHLTSYKEKKEEYERMVHDFINNADI